MTALLWGWVLLFLVLLGLVVRDGQRGGTLVLAYFVGLSLIHVPGALIYTGTAPMLADGFDTKRGFIATLVGLVFFVAGAWIATWRGRQALAASNLHVADYGKIAPLMLGLGFGIYFILIPIVYLIPSATSIFSGGGSLLPIGFWCIFYAARENNQPRLFWIGFALLPLLPLATMVGGGFIGFGIYWVIAVCAFVYCTAPRKSVYVLVSPLVVVLGLSFSVAYFTERVALREAVWYQQAGLGDRFAHVLTMFESFEWIDLENPEHIKPINDRLNQNIFVGRAIEQRELGMTEPALGGTVPLWAFIPRAIWANKPAIGGSGDIVSRYTGIHLATGTSFGVGQPLEFYINFEWWGIVVGFSGLGYVLMALDRRLTASFQRRDVQGLLMAGMPGLALLQPGGSLMEMLVATVGAYLCALIVWALLKKTGTVGMHRPDGAAAERGASVVRRL